MSFIGQIKEEITEEKTPEEPALEEEVKQQISAQEDSHVPDIIVTESVQEDAFNSTFKSAVPDIDADKKTFNAMNFVKESLSDQMLATESDDVDADDYQSLVEEAPGNEVIPPSENDGTDKAAEPLSNTAVTGNEAEPLETDLTGNAAEASSESVATDNEVEPASTTAVADNEVNSLKDSCCQDVAEADQLVHGEEMNGELPLHQEEVAGKKHTAQQVTQQQTILPRMVDGNTVLDMHLSFVTSPSSFWCQFQESADELLGLMAEMAEYCSQDDLKSLTSLPDVGSFCCARFMDDDQWYRGEVVDIVDSTTCLIKFVDYGNVDQVCVDRLKPLHERFYPVLKQCIECSLLGIKPNTADAAAAAWSKDAIAEFEEICADKMLHIEVFSQELNKINVVVKMADSDISVNQIMTEKEFAVFDEAKTNGCH